MRAWSGGRGPCWTPSDNYRCELDLCRGREGWELFSISMVRTLRACDLDGTENNERVVLAPGSRTLSTWIRGRGLDAGRGGPIVVRPLLLGLACRTRAYRAPARSTRLLTRLHFSYRCSCSDGRGSSDHNDAGLSSCHCILLGVLPWGRTDEEQLQRGASNCQ